MNRTPNTLRQDAGGPEPTNPTVSRSRGFDRLAILGLLTLFSAVLLLLAVRTLPTRIAHDSPIMFYLAFLIEHFHVIPYRETFDMNMPGSYFLYAVLGRLTGYSDLGIRLADMGLLLVLMTATWLTLRGISPLSAWAAAVIFPLFYLLEGPMVDLQREFLILVFLTVALAVLFRAKNPAAPLPNILMGLLLGICVTIKPQLALVWVLFPLYQGQRIKDISGEALSEKPALASVWGASAFGFLMPIVAMFVYLISVHALSAFMDVAHNYWPLYGALNGQNHALYGTARLKYLLINLLKFSTNARWVPTALLGLWVALTQGDLLLEQHRQVKMLAALAVYFTIYPVFSGQFWLYHALPMLYFAIVLTSLSLVPLSSAASVLRWLSVLRVAALVFVLLLAASRLHHFRMDMHPEEGRADQIAAYLRTHENPGDRVQPLDWTGGAVHALLMTRTRIATPFIYDFYFYHHVSNPYIQGLRQRFIQDLSAAPPRFIIQVVTDQKPWPTGQDTTREFPALQTILRTQYHPVQAQNGYILLERNHN
jgi:hypothetical protein